MPRFCLLEYFNVVFQIILLSIGVNLLSVQSYKYIPRQLDEADTLTKKFIVLMSLKTDDSKQKLLRLLFLQSLKTKSTKNKVSALFLQL